MTSMVNLHTPEATRGVVFGIFSVAAAVLAAGVALGDWAFLGALVLVLGGLGWSGTRWGADSTDGKDWKPRRPW